MPRRQRQKSGRDSMNVQVGRDLTIQGDGLTADDVRDIALSLFQQNFLELRGLAEDVARGRAEKITTDFLRALEERAPLALGSASDPDMQRAIFEAQREYACSGDNDLEAVLVDLLVDRASEPGRETRTIVLNEAITAAPKLTQQQRRAIAVCFLVKYTRWTGRADVVTFYEQYIRGNLLPLAEDADETGGLPAHRVRRSRLDWYRLGGSHISAPKERPGLLHQRRRCRRPT